MCKSYLVISFAINLLPQNSQKLVLSFKMCCKIPILADNEMYFFLYIFFILAESGRGRHSIAEKEDKSNGTIVPFVTSDDLRRDHETCWLLDVRSLTNPPDLFPDKRLCDTSGRVELV